MRMLSLQAQLGKRIVYLRLKKGWSQFELSLEANINKNYVSDLEHGRRNPTLKILVRLAHVFDMDLSELLKGIKEIE
jgi:transcriptional regulator with XRE-family HTH domain